MDTRIQHPIITLRIPTTHPTLTHTSALDSVSATMAIRTTVAIRTIAVTTATGADMAIMEATGAVTTVIEAGIREAFAASREVAALSAVQESAAAAN